MIFSRRTKYLFDKRKKNGYGDKRLTIFNTMDIMLFTINQKGGDYRYRKTVQRAVQTPEQARIFRENLHRIYSAVYI
jgi:hypothetical protein